MSARQNVARNTSPTDLTVFNSTDRDFANELYVIDKKTAQQQINNNNI